MEKIIGRKEIAVSPSLRDYDKSEVFALMSKLYSGLALEASQNIDSLLYKEYMENHFIFHVRLPCFKR
jgi:hypothetical protein